MTLDLTLPVTPDNQYAPYRHRYHVTLACCCLLLVSTAALAGLHFSKQRQLRQLMTSPDVARGARGAHWELYGSAALYRLVLHITQVCLDEEAYIGLS